MSTDTDPEDESFLSKQLLQLSYHDRNAISEEIHGVRCLAAQETPHLISQALMLFERHVQALPFSKKTAYNKILYLKNLRKIEVSRGIADSFMQQQNLGHAHRQILSFIDHDEFRMRFLRCELFDIKKAASRFLDYLDLSHELFGDAVLHRPVCLSDFTRAELKVLRKGFFQILPYRDRAGRRVLVCMGATGDDVEPETRAKIFFYMRDILTRDSVESQRKGGVFVADLSVFENSRTSFSPAAFALIQRVIQAVPTRMVAIHNCFPDRPKWRVLGMLPAAAGPFYSTRICSQIGNKVEMRYKLKGYGIPIHTIPVRESGDIKVKSFHQWLKLRKTIEEATAEDYANRQLGRIVECPGLNDVVFRQGTPSRKSTGNFMFRDAMVAQLENHFGPAGSAATEQLTDGVSRNELMEQEEIDQFCQILIDAVISRHGRFLEWDKNLNVWMHLNDEARIRFKVGIAFRELTKRFLNRRPRMDATNKDTTRTEGSDSPSNIDLTYTFVEGGNKAKRRCCLYSSYDNECCST